MVVCPMHGAGVIESIKEMDVNGEQRMYYVVSLAVGNIKIMVPVSLESSHIRTVTTTNDAIMLMSSLKDLQIEQNTNWSKRYRDNMDKLKSGDILETARVMKSLILRNKEKTLSAGERKMLHSAKQILISELVLSLNTDKDELEQTIYDAIG